MVANSKSTRPAVSAGMRLATSSGTNSTFTPSSLPNSALHVGVETFLLAARIDKAPRRVVALDADDDFALAS